MRSGRFALCLNDASSRRQVKRTRTVRTSDVQIACQPSRIYVLPRDRVPVASKLTRETRRARTSDVTCALVRRRARQMACAASRGRRATGVTANSLPDAIRPRSLNA